VLDEHPEPKAEQPTEPAAPAEASAEAVTA